MRRARATIIGFALLAVSLPVSDARAGVADPLTALRALYKDKVKAAAPDTKRTISTLYEWADRALKRKLLANGVCTVPFRSRDITCSLVIDPTVAGLQMPLPMPDPTFTANAPSPTERTVTATIVDEDMKFDVAYRFTRTGSTWELSDLEARPPQGKSWRLSELIGGN